MINLNGRDLTQVREKDGLYRYIDNKRIFRWKTVNKVYFLIEALHPDNGSVIIKTNIVNNQLAGKNFMLVFDKKGQLKGNKKRTPGAVAGTVSNTQPGL